MGHHPHHQEHRHHGHQTEDGCRQESEPQECGCDNHEPQTCDCQRQEPHDCCCGGHSPHQGCQCGCHDRHRLGFQRRFATREERVAELEAYLKALKAEALAVEEHIQELQAKGKVSP